MNRIVQVLVAMASLVVIAAGGIWLHGQKQAADEARNRAADFALVEQFRREVFARAAKEKAQAEINQCAADLDAFDNGGSTLAFVHRVAAAGDTLTGDTLASFIQSCRDITRPKPSEQPG